MAAFSAWVTCDSNTVTLALLVAFFLLVAFMLPIARVPLCNGLSHAGAMYSIFCVFFQLIIVGTMHYLGLCNAPRDQARSRAARLATEVEHLQFLLDEAHAKREAMGQEAEGAQRAAVAAGESMNLHLCGELECGPATHAGVCACMCVCACAG